MTKRDQIIRGFLYWELFCWNIYDMLKTTIKVIRIVFAFVGALFYDLFILIIEQVVELEAMELLIAIVLVSLIWLAPQNVIRIIATIAVLIIFKIFIIHKRTR